MVKVTAFLVFMICASTVSFAQEDIYESQFYGFSDDMKYCAFETYKSSGGEGFRNESRIYFIDVEKNDYAVKPLLRMDDPANPGTSTANRAANKKEAEKYFVQFKIKGGRLGTPVNIQLDTEDYMHSSFPDQAFSSNGSKYVVHLVTVPDPSGEEIDFRSKAMFEVQLEKNGVTTILQKAIPTPTSWGFVYGYQIKSIFYLNARIAVFVEYFTPGFENYPNRNQMIVTGKM